MKVKVGDRIRVTRLTTKAGHEHYDRVIAEREVGVVTKRFPNGPYPVVVQFDSYEHGMAFKDEELEGV